MDLANISAPVSWVVGDLLGVWLGGGALLARPAVPALVWYSFSCAAIALINLKSTIIKIKICAGTIIWEN